MMNDPAPEQDDAAGLRDRAAIEVTYELVAAIASVVGGWLASMAFARIWRAMAGKREVPDVTDPALSWARIVPAAALLRIVFGVVKALVDDAAAKEFERMTRAWPGKPVGTAPVDAHR